ncbi:Sexual differentiation process protein isp4 [Leucoagaricus sp. SymC.cos]|nr:Sexual differentiation process protein isp4 [Leucoagaricus sp. SymC.cos]
MAEQTPHYAVAHERHSSKNSVDDEKRLEEGVPVEALDDSHIADLTGAQFDDPNLDKEHITFDDESPYPEVRSAVANTDDPTMPVSTLRSWIIGLIWAILIPGLNQFFFFRFPSVTITGIVAQLLSFPIGRAAAAFIPNWSIFGLRLNPGPFTVKEHVLVTIMATVGWQSAYATDIIAVQRVYYNQIYNFSYQWFLVMSTQLIGFSIGGVAKRFLVSPPSMIWPLNLVNCALFNTLHSQQYAGIGTRGGISRERFFIYGFIASFAWYFFPGYIFQALSYFSWVTWIRPDNPTIAQLFGLLTPALQGMSVITFDWSQIAYIGSPLATPWWAEANIFAGFVFFFWILCPILHFTNTWYGEYMPISSRTSYDNTGNEYNVTRILTPEATFDAEAYRNYSPLFLSTTFAITYGLSFASITATLMHAFLYFRKQIWVQARRSLHEQADIHARLMARYPQVPEWWYLIVLASMFALGIISIEVWPSQMPVWAFVLALVIAFTYVIPIGMIQAITNQQVGLNVITELIIGYALPGRPVAMMMFKTWGYITMAQALQFTSDFKLGHYMKIPPRTMFVAQVLAAVVAGTVQLGVQAWMFTNIENMCDPHQRDGFICPSTEVFGTASIIVRVIGPGLQFSKGQTYYRMDENLVIIIALLFFFLVGAVAPVIPWVLSKKWPNSFLKYVNPVIFNGTGLIPPATAINYVPWAAVGFIFQYVVRRRHFSWWTKYNYVLSAALDSGVAISIVIIFFCLQFPRNGAVSDSSARR